MSRGATPLEAYITGLLHVSLLVPPVLPRDLHAAIITNDEGQVTGEIEIHDHEGNVRASILVTERDAG